MWDASRGLIERLRGITGPRQREQVELDTTSPFARGIGSLWVPTHVAAAGRFLGPNIFLQNLAQSDNAPVDNLGWFTSGTEPALVASPLARGLSFAGPGGVTRTAGLAYQPLAAGGHQAATIAVVAHTNANPTGQTNLYGFSRNVANGAPNFRIGVDASNIFGYIQLRSGGVDTAFGVTKPNAGEPFVAIFASAALNDHRFWYYNIATGEFASGTTSTIVTGANAEVNRESIGEWASSFIALVANATIYEAAYWSRAFDDTDAVNFARAPFALLKVTSNLAPSRFIAVEPPIPVGSDIEGDLAVTLEDAVLASTAVVTVSAELEVTLEDAVLEAASVQVGEGVVGDLTVTLEGAVLVAEAEVAVIANLAVTLDDAALVAFAVSGDVGPFAPRPFLYLN